MAPILAVLVKQVVVTTVLWAGARSGALAAEAACPRGSPGVGGACVASEASRHDVSEGISLLSVKSHMDRKVQTLTLERVYQAEGSHRVSCTPLENRGSHSVVEVKVGTPPQSFSVVADTGSNSLIIVSCICTEAGYCGKENRCFRGTNKSETFHFDSKQKELMLTFGSGEIQAAEAVDVVDIAGVKVNMTDGILLETYQLLDFGGPFEGILGLGPPLPQKEEEEPDASKSATSDGLSGVDGENVSDVWKKIFGNLGDVFGKDKGKETVYGSADERMVGKFGAEEVSGPNGFLEQANISRFSMCFNDGAAGVLRLGTPKMPKAHQSIGTEHWGLALEGISVGDGTSMLQALAAPANDSAEEANRNAVELCSKETMKEGQMTPCGLIPDSGTTQIMAPQVHIDALHEAICDQWPRCSENYTALIKAVEDAKKVIVQDYKTNPFDFKVSSKGEVLAMVLADCEAWLKDVDLDELPAVHFHVAGNTSKQTVTIPARTWLVETEQEEKKYDYFHIDGLGDVPYGLNTTDKGKKVKVCLPSFGVMEYETEANGPVWILGTPVFYEYMVGYDLDHKTVSFTSQEEEPCGTCDEKVGLITSKDKPARAKRTPRQQSGEPRMPSIDSSRPL